jgi:carbon storage regulator
MLVLTRKEDEKIIIDDNIELTVVEVGNGKVQLGIDAPQEIEIHREEIYRKIEEENIEAGRKSVDINQLKKLKMNNG